MSGKMWPIAVACVLMPVSGACAATEDYLYFTGDTARGPSGIDELRPRSAIFAFADGFETRGLAFGGPGYLDSINAGVVSKLGGGQITPVANLNDASFNTIASDTGGDIFVGSASESLIIRIGPDGSQSTAAHLVANSLAADPSGNLFVLGPSGTVYKVAPDGTVSNYLTIATNATQALATDLSGDLYALGLNSLTEVTPQNTVSTVVAGLTDPNAVTVDAAGAIFLSQAHQGDLGEDSIDQVSNGSIVHLAEYPPIASEAGALVASPNQVVVPEPATTTVAGLVSVLVLKRRRRPATAVTALVQASPATFPD